MVTFRDISLLRLRMLLVLIASAFTINAVVPTGHMLAPSSSYLIEVVPCPSTNPLVRAFAQIEDASEVVDHAAMGHGDMAHAMPTGGVDHAAMGHKAPSPDEDAPARTQASKDCAFSSLSFAATVPDKPADFLTATDPAEALATLLSTLAIARVRYLRPPLRAPPSLT